MTSGAIRLGTLELASAIMNSAGPWAASLEDLIKLDKSQAGAVVTKTFTLEPTVGNPQPNTYFHDDFSINSVGLTNRGADYFVEAARSLSGSKPVIASVYGADIDEFKRVIKKVNAAFDAIEINLSCPNCEGKEPIAYFPAQLEAFFAGVLPAASLPVGVKLPPYVMRSQLRAVAAVLRRHPINHVVLINSYPLATALVNGAPAIKPNSGVGGLGGSYLKPIALAHVALFKSYAPDLPIVGVGGVGAKQDTADFLAVGATAVQVGTVIQRRGMRAFAQLSS